MWSDPQVASKYRGAEQITGVFAKFLLLQAGLPDAHASEPKKPPIVLDNACGTGVVSENLWEMLDEHAKEELQLLCGDISEGMVGHIKKKIEEKGWHGADARVLDAMKTGLQENYFTHVISNFGLMLMPDSDAALKGMPAYSYSFVLHTENHQYSDKNHRMFPHTPTLRCLCSLYLGHCRLDPRRAGRIRDSPRLAHIPRCRNLLRRDGQR